MADIFVSYATEDHERVRPLVEALEANGFEVWWARNILGGEDFSAEIERQIHVASAVIVAWSKRAVASSWVRDEAVIARDANKLVPVRLDAVEAPLGFRQLQVIDLERWSGEPGAPALNQVLAAIQRTSGATSLAHQASIPRWSSMRRGMEKLRANKALTAASGLALGFLRRLGNRGRARWSRRRASGA